MDKVKVSSTGGARIGWVNATWPFAKLNVSQNKIDLNATLIGRYSFSPDQVVDIEKYTTIPVLGWGIQIHHNIATYPKKIIFWCLGDPKTLISKIKQAGFVANASPNSVLPSRGIPVKWQAILAATILWNLLFLMDMLNSQQLTGKPGWFSLLAVFLLFLGSIAMWRDNWLQRLFLKADREPSEIKSWLYLLALVSGLMSFIMFITLVIEMY